MMSSHIPQPLAITTTQKFPKETLGTSVTAFTKHQCLPGSLGTQFPSALRGEHRGLKKEGRSQAREQSRRERQGFRVLALSVELRNLDKLRP